MTKLFNKSLALQLGIDDEDIATRKQLLGFSEADVRELLIFAGAAREISTAVIEEFYRYQISIPEIRRMIGDTETLARLMGSMRRYVAMTFSGVYDADYVNDRLRVGQAHARIGVPPKHFVAATIKLRDLIGDYLMTSGLIEAPPKALDKLFLFDLELIFDVYLHGVNTELQTALERVRSGTARVSAPELEPDEASMDEILSKAMRKASVPTHVA